jgi:GTP-binding protein
MRALFALPHATHPMSRALRNIAIIAHVDHGKTTLVDQLLRQSGTFAAHQAVAERVMDSNDLEKERGITILSKNCAIDYQGTHINIVDTPGHADFGGEVERVLSMVDGVLLLVDAVEGPMPQTRFVTRKALALGLKPIVVVNKIDRPGARPDWVINHTFDLFDKLGATEEQLDFPVVFASALNGFAMLDATKPGTDMAPLYEAIIKHTPQPDVDVDKPLQLQICSIDYNSYVGRIGIGRIKQGRMKAGQEVAVMYGDENKGKSKIGQIMMFTGLEREQATEAEAGDIVLVTGIEQVGIGVTVCDPAAPVGMPPLVVDEPTLTMNFQVNTSPLAGKEGKYVTSRQIRERLNKELLANVALRVEETDDADVFLVSGRGELHLTILLETMRREGYELAVSRPRVLFKEINGEKCEPYELLTVDIENDHQGAVMEELGRRRGELLNMESDGKGRVRLEYRIPARGLIGFQGEFLTATRGTGMASHIFDDYGPMAGVMAERRNGVLISQDDGAAVAYALWKLQDRGRMFVSPGDPLYEGIIIGVHSRDNDLVVNPIKGKQLTNVRASGTDEAVRLVPPILMTLESAVEFIADDELVEITPKSIRLRKRHLKEFERKRANREENPA